MRQLKVGDRVLRTPQTFNGDALNKTTKDTKPIEGVVDYIHPRGRFHVVSFKTGSGKYLTECFPGCTED